MQMQVITWIKAAADDWMSREARLHFNWKNENQFHSQILAGVRKYSRESERELKEVRDLIVPISMASTSSTPPPTTSASSSSSSTTTTSSTTQSLPSSSSVAPKILLAKPVTTPTESTALLRSRLPSLGSLSLLSDSWDLHTDRILPFLTENTDFTVVGVIGPPGAGKSTILNEVYGFDATSPGMLPPFGTQSEETRAMARHCTVGIELRVSTERLILLDTQPIFSPSVLSETMRPDGLSTVSLYGETLPAELAHELMSIQLAVFLASICHVLLVVTEGVHDTDMWRLMLTVDLLKHGIPDPSSLVTAYSHNSNLGSEKDSKSILQGFPEEYLACPVFVHTKLRDQDLPSNQIETMRKTLSQYFTYSSFMEVKHGSTSKEHWCLVENSDIETNNLESSKLQIHLIPYKTEDDTQRAQSESYSNALAKLRDQILSMNSHTFAKTVSERDWLRNLARIWETVKSSPIIAEYSRTLQSSGDMNYRQ